MVGVVRLDVEDAIIAYNYCERIKSELLILLNLVEEAFNIEGAAAEGAKRIVLSFLNALMGEVRIAVAAVGGERFSEVEAYLMKCLESFKLGRGEDVREHIGESVSVVATVCQQATDLLKSAGLLKGC